MSNNNNVNVVEFDFKKASLSELKSFIHETKKTLLNLRFQMVVNGSIQNTNRFSKLKKDIARAKTAISMIKINVKE